MPSTSSAEALASDRSAWRVLQGLRQSTCLQYILYAFTGRFFGSLGFRKGSRKVVGSGGGTSTVRAACMNDGAEESRRIRSIKAAFRKTHAGGRVLGSISGHADPAASAPTHRGDRAGKKVLVAPLMRQFATPVAVVLYPICMAGFMLWGTTCWVFARNSNCESVLV